MLCGLKLVRWSNFVVLSYYLWKLGQYLFDMVQHSRAISSTNMWFEMDIEAKRRLRGNPHVCPFVNCTIIVLFRVDYWSFEGISENLVSIVGTCCLHFVSSHWECFLGRIFSWSLELFLSLICNFCVFVGLLGIIPCFWYNTNITCQHEFQLLAGTH